MSRVFHTVYLCLPGVFFLFISPVQAEVRLANVFSSNMVLQRNASVPVWGTAAPGEEIIIEFRESTYKTSADNLGQWEVQLKPQKEGGPFQLIVQGQNRILLENILVGDVWLCAGQSNMEWPLEETTDGYRGIAESSHDRLRLLHIPRTGALSPAEDIPANNWAISGPHSTRRFSAVGYYFGKEILETQDIPVGLIQAAWGGTMIEGWMREALLRGYPDAVEKLTYLEQFDQVPIREEKLATWREEVASLDPGLRDGEPVWALSGLDDSGWQTFTFPGYWEEERELEWDGSVWFRKTVEISESPAADGVLHLGLVDDVADIYVNGHQLDKEYQSKWLERIFSVPAAMLNEGENVITLRILDYDLRGGIGGVENEYYLKLNNTIYPLYGEWKMRKGANAAKLEQIRANLDEKHLPAIMYNGMIHPIRRLPVTGVIWYQGESNTKEPGRYEEMLKSMIRDWRTWWGDDLTFLVVQLSSFEEPELFYPFGDWAQIREAQQQVLDLPGTGVAVTIDLSDPGNPNNIHPRDKAPVGHRLALLARQIAYNETIIASGPVPTAAEFREHTVLVTFENTAGGLATSDPYGYLRGFRIRTQQGDTLNVRATIEENKILLEHPDLTGPVEVLYGWSDYPADANLKNEAGLPASPFRIKRK